MAAAARLPASLEHAECRAALPSWNEGSTGVSREAPALRLRLLAVLLAVG